MTAFNESNDFRCRIGVLNLLGNVSLTEEGCKVIELHWIDVSSFLFFSTENLDVLRSFLTVLVNLSHNHNCLRLILDTEVGLFILF